LLWKCPTPRLLDLYNAHVTANHLEVGVGTGYFLDRCRFPARPRLVLVDLNRNCLEAASRRVRRYSPRTVRGSVLEPIPYDGEPFTSAGLNYVLHCLPGDLKSKARVFDHIRALLAPSGVVFGATLLARGVRAGFLARRLMRLYNACGFFGNADDSPDDLREALASRFTSSQVEVVGCAGLFVARK
jgi:hypothetical protein